MNPLTGHRQKELLNIKRDQKREKKLECAYSYAKHQKQADGDFPKDLKKSLHSIRAVSQQVWL